MIFFDIRKEELERNGFTHEKEVRYRFIKNPGQLSIHYQPYLTLDLKEECYEMLSGVGTYGHFNSLLLSAPSEASIAR